MELYYVDANVIVFALLKFAIWYWNTFLSKCGLLYIILMSISTSTYYYFFFANDLLAIYFIFILDYGSDVRQKANSSNFLIWAYNGLKAAETTHKINNAFGPGTAYEHAGQWWFKKFCKGDESLEYEHSDQPSERNHWEKSSKLILLHEKLLKNSVSTILQSSGIWS